MRGLHGYQERTWESLTAAWRETQRGIVGLFTSRGYPFCGNRPTGKSVGDMVLGLGKALWGERHQGAYPRAEACEWIWVCTGYGCGMYGYGYIWVSISGMKGF